MRPSSPRGSFLFRADKALPEPEDAGGSTEQAGRDVESFSCKINHVVIQVNVLCGITHGSLWGNYLPLTRSATYVMKSCSDVKYKIIEALKKAALFCRQRKKGSISSTAPELQNRLVKVAISTAEYKSNEQCLIEIWCADVLIFTRAENPHQHATVSKWSLDVDRRANVKNVGKKQNRPYQALQWVFKLVSWVLFWLVQKTRKILMWNSR